MFLERAEPLVREHISYPDLIQLLVVRLLIVRDRGEHELAEPCGMGGYVRTE